MDKILVVIPYWAPGAQGHELELAVTGWRKHFKEDYHIVIVGDCPSCGKGILQIDEKAFEGLDAEKFAQEFAKYEGVIRIEQVSKPAEVTPFDDITYIECPQVAPVQGQYLPHLDHVNKFRKVREAFPDSKGFIYTCDDIYPTADFTLEDVLQPKEPKQGFYFALTHLKSTTPDWYSDKQKTGELCHREHLPVRNWVCHLPVYYEWDKLFEVYDKYNCDHESHIVENIYFNIMYPGDPHAVSEIMYHDEVKTSRPGIRPIGTVKWVSNANCGWSQELEDILRKHYGL